MFIEKVVHFLKRLLNFLVKAVYITPFVIFGLWLIQLAYFPHWVYIPQFIHAMKVTPEIAKTVTEFTGKEEMIKKIEKHANPIPRGHFHLTDKYIERLIHQLDTNPPLCLICHGTYPHRKEKKTRSILNLHNGFMVCEVCHVRKDPEDDKFSFVWVNLETGKTSMKVEGSYGKYPAKIAPIKTVNGHSERVDEQVRSNFSQEYLLLKGKYTPNQLAEMETVHEHNLTKKPVSCKDCHKINGYLDLAELGFPRYRINQLSQSEIAGMVEHYKTFYMPKMFDLK